MVMAMNKCVEVGDCHSDLEIDFLVGKRLNPKAWPWDNVADFFTEQLHNGGVDMTFEDLQDHGWLQMDFEYRKYEKGLLRPTASPASTPPPAWWSCARVCTRTGARTRCPTSRKTLTPYSRPDLAEEYPLIMTTGGRDTTSFHSEHRQVASLRAIMPNPLVQINPETAARYGIEDGDWVCIENPLGKAIEKAQVTPTVDPRVIHAQHGWWYPEQDAETPNLNGVWKSNINSLRPALRHRAHRFRRAVQERALQDTTRSTALTRSARWTPTARRAPSEPTRSSFVAEAIATGQEA